MQQDNAPAHRARETVQMLSCETPDFIAPALWPASPDLYLVDYQTWGKHRSRMHDVDQLKSRMIEEWEHFHQVFIDEAIRQWRLRLPACIRATRRTFGTQTLVVFDICTDVQSCLCGCLWTLLFWGDLTKPSISIASVDRFYLNLVICLQIRHCIVGFC